MNDKTKGALDGVEVKDLTYVGAEEDNEEQAYPSDLLSALDTVDTFPPETKEEAERRAAEAKTAGEDDEDGEEDTDTTEADGEVDEKAKGGDSQEADEDAGDEDESDDEPRVPHSRFEEINKRRKTAEERVAQLEAELAAERDAKKVLDSKEPPEPDFDFDAEEERYMEAVLQGDKDEAKQIRAAIRKAEKDMYAKQAAEQANTSLKVSAEEQAFIEAGNKLEKAYPILSEENEGFNPQLLDEVVELYQAYLGTGKYTMAQAIEKATNTTMKVNGIAPAGEEAAPAKKAKSTPTQKDAEKKKGVAAKQPPKRETSTSPDVEVTANVASISDEEWAALPESTKRKLRGDYSVASK